MRGVRVYEAAAVRPELLDGLLRGNEGLKFWMTPWDIRTTAPARLIGRSTQSVARTRSDQKLPMPFDSTRATPLTNAIAIAMPVAADAKLWTARPALWVKRDIVDSPEEACQFV